MEKLCKKWKHRLCLFVFVVMGVIIQSGVAKAATAIQGGDSAANAVSVNCNQEYEGTISASDKVDWVKFEVAADGTKHRIMFENVDVGDMITCVLFRLDNSGQVTFFSDPDITLKNGGIKSTEINPQRGENNKGNVRYCLLDQGTYVMKMSCASSANGTYKFQVLNQKVSGITLTMDTTTLTGGQAYNIQANVFPENAVDSRVTFDTNNTNSTSITIPADEITNSLYDLSVRKAIVNAKKKTGTATITCTAKDGGGGTGSLLVNVVCNHSWMANSSTEPTCTTEGSCRRICATCNAVDTQTIPALGHDFSVVQSVVDPTATTQGYTVYKCSRCSATENRDFTPATGGAVECQHTTLVDYPEDSRNQAATCGQAGVRVKKCSSCTWTTTEPIPATGNHTWADAPSDSRNQAATCIQSGVKVKKCSGCSQTTTESIPALGHTNGVEDASHEEAVAPTCTTAGVKVFACTRCHKALSKETIDATGHSGWHVITHALTKAATCTEKGCYVEQCGVCSDIRKNYIDALDHDFSVKLQTVDPTATTQGHTVYKCSRCEQTTKLDYKPALGAPVCVEHNWVKVDNHEDACEATCTNKGLEIYQCSVCHLPNPVWVEKLGHTQGVEAPNHEDARSATCVTTGVRVKVCERCGCKVGDDEEIPALGHDYSVRRNTVPPTTTSEGYTVYQCSRCDDTIEKDWVPVLCTHNWVDDSADSRNQGVTCTQPGVKVQKCSHCGETKTISIPATGNHNYVQQSVVAPTATDQGYTLYKCSLCGEEKRDQYVAATGGSTGDASGLPSAPTPQPIAAVATVGTSSYQTTAAGTAAISATSNKKCTSVSVPDTIVVGNVTYRVTDISANAYKNCKKLKNVTIGSNIQTIGKNAFKGCKKLKKIVIKSKNLKKIGKGAFKGIPKNATIKVPKGMKKKYKKLFKKAGLPSGVKIK